MKKKGLALTISTIFIIASLITGCCNEIYSGTQEVDVDPLYQAPIPVSPTLAIFHVEDYGATVTNNVYTRFDWPIEDPALAKTSSIEVILELQSDDVSRWFESDCSAYLKTTSKFIFGGEGDNQYCISYVSEFRNPPEPLCLGTGEYESYVVFQKGKIIITIREYSSDKKSTLKNAVITQLAKDLNSGK
jgi:hypothetical protein